MVVSSINAQLAFLLACSAQVDVDVPVDKAWDLWRDKTQIIKWMPWINRIEIVPDDPKQSKWVLCTDQFGRHWELSWRALDLTPIKHQKVPCQICLHVDDVRNPLLLIFLLSVLAFVDSED